jgi:TolA-binding protein
MRRAANTLQNKQQILKALKQVKKNQETLEKKLDKIIENQTTAQDAADVATTAAEKSWLKQFVEDSDIEALQAVTTAGSAVTSGIGLTHYVINKNLNEEQRIELVSQTRTDYVTLELLDNNILITDFYQKSDKVTLFHTEKTKKSWYKFWS